MGCQIYFGGLPQVKYMCGKHRFGHQLQTANLQVYGKSTDGQSNLLGKHLEMS